VTRTTPVAENAEIGVPAALFIDNEFRAAADGRLFDSIDPSTETAFAKAARGGAADIDAAVKAAHAAMRGPWRELTPAERGRLLFRLADAIETRRDAIARVETLDVGKPLRESRGDVGGVCATIRYNAGAADKMEGATVPLGRNFVDYTVLEPLGVTAHIVPWNYPLGMVARSVAPALAAGCTVVIKPAEQSPMTALMFADICRKVGFPAGVVNVVTGFGDEAGAALTKHPLVRGITFTGSVETGRKVYLAAAQGIKPTVLELGGKNPMIVLPGADVERTAAGAIHACLHGAGQTCVSIERVYVHDSLYDEFRDAFARRVEALEIGPGDSWDTEIGSLVSADQVEGVVKHVDDAIANGATVVAGGNARPDLGPFFHEPTVLEGVTSAAACYGEETFGPLVSLYRYSDVEDAVRLANEGEYGLNASVWGPERDAKRIAPRIKAGTINVNEGFMANFASIDTPMGGMRMSGTGRRHGREGILRYTEPQTVAVQRFVPTLLPDGIPFRTRSRIWSFLVNKLGWMVKP